MALGSDELTGWAPAGEARVVSIERVRAERAEQRAAVLAGREATNAVRQLSAVETAEAWRKRARAADERERGRQWREATVLGLGVLIVALTLPIWCMAMGWPGAAALLGIVVAGALVAWLRWTGAW